MTKRWLTIAAVAVALVATIVVRNGIEPRTSAKSPLAPHTTAGGDGLPTFVDVGANNCIPCKMMQPILTELETELAGKLDVVFIDIWKDRRAAAPYRVSAIPTQIFYDDKGTELFRHVGFFSKEEILGEWKDLGFDFVPIGAPKSGT